jgi:hypothetical protein
MVEGLTCFRVDIRQIQEGVFGQKCHTMKRHWKTYLIRLGEHVTTVVFFFSSGTTGKDMH